MITTAQDAHCYDAVCDAVNDEPMDEPEPSDVSKLYALLDAALGYRAEAIIWVDRGDIDTESAVVRWYETQLAEHRLVLERSPAIDRTRVLMISLNHARIATLYIR